MGVGVGVGVGVGGSSVVRARDFRKRHKPLVPFIWCLRQGK